MSEELWPALPYEEWKDTYATLHMWVQMAGKIALALAPPLNHCWSSALLVSAHGLTARTLRHGDRAFTLEFDFVEHRLHVRCSDGAERSLALEPRSVADFYRELMATLNGMSLPVKIWSMPMEIPDPIRFEEDTVHASYDAEAANRFWRILLRVEEALTASRCRFIGKASPVHFFWGSFDLAVTRFSGRTAPPREGPGWMRDAYSHEVISHGFWPGSGLVLEPALYAYAVPEPEGLKEAPVAPPEAYYHREMGEFLLPYEAVRKSKSPEQAIQAFVDSTYARAADLGKWDRRALER